MCGSQNPVHSTPSYFILKYLYVLNVLTVQHIFSMRSNDSTQPLLSLLIIFMRCDANIQVSGVPFKIIMVPTPTASQQK